MKRTFCLLLTVLIISLAFFGCSGEDDDTRQSDKITYYTVKDTYSIGTGWIYDYNKACKNEDDEIEIVEFESADALKNKLTTELMSGGGPDIMNELMIDLAGLSIEKLIAMEAFMDLNELINSDTSDDKIDISEHNQKALESGISDGKRFCIPLYYIPKFLLTTKEKYSKYINSSTPSLSYDDMLSLCEKLLTDESDIYLYTYYDTYNLQGILLDYIDDNVDLINKTADFDKPEFKENISRIDKLIKEYGDDQSVDEEILIDLTEEVDPNKYIFENMASTTPYEIYSSIVFLEQRGETPQIVGSASSDTETFSAQISESIYVNKNTTKQDKVLKALKYALSEETQSEIVGAEIEKYNPMFQSYTGYLFPVNNNSFEKLMNTADSFTYNTEDSYYVGDDDGIPDDDKEQAPVSDESKELLHNALNNISKYELDTYLYYNTSIIDELVDSFVKHEITVDKFISDLKSKTKIYLEE